MIVKVSRESEKGSRITSNPTEKLRVLLHKVGRALVGRVIVEQEQRISLAANLFWSLEP